ncbi:MAG: exodeoxyribonuclease VII large subunit [Ignavibacteriaceae bacterium]|nr:exodeoxyribonuclease VII large subunit [Ignavibacteriaceae bacterium]
MSAVLTVSEITKEIKQILEDGFSSVSIIGEISGFKAHISGHWYFNLKDSNAVISCTMWRSMNSNVFFTPQDGMKVILTGKITVYPPRGNYQVDVRNMRPAGAGELQAAFELLKQKLAAEGLFDQKYKKPLPVLSKKIGIITAIDGAAFQDMKSVAERRFPLVEILICPTRVQGSGAAELIAENIAELNKFKDIDVIILARGGGSIEDLWAFNEEIVARAIFKSKIPIVTGVGHEVDFTIADFVADLRAPTPSAAMEILTPDKNDIISIIKEYDDNSLQQLEKIFRSKKEKVHSALNSYGFRTPAGIIRRRAQEIDNFLYKIIQSTDKNILIQNNRLSLLVKSLESHDINRTLKKGFVLVKQDSKFISRSEILNKEVPALLKFYDGKVTVKISE